MTLAVMIKIITVDFFYHPNIITMSLIVVVVVVVAVDDVFLLSFLPLASTA